MSLWAEMARNYQVSSQMALHSAAPTSSQLFPAVGGRGGQKSSLKPGFRFACGMPPMTVASAVQIYIPVPGSQNLSSALAMVVGSWSPHGDLDGLSGDPFPPCPGDAQELPMGNEANRSCSKCWSSLLAPRELAGSGLSKVLAPYMSHSSGLVLNSLFLM